MNPAQQRQHGQAVAQVHKRIDTLAKCVDAEVAEKMTEIRTLATGLISAESTARERAVRELHAYVDLMDQDARTYSDRQFEALSTRLEVFEKMTGRGLLRWLRARAWR